MARLRIPNAYRPTLERLLQIEDAELDELERALASESLSDSPQQLAISVAAKVSGFSKADVSGIVRTILSLYALRNNTESSVAELVEDLSAAIQEGPTPNLTLDQENRERFRHVMLRLLSVPSLSRESRVLDLLHEYEHAYCSARVLTDIRPVFGSDVDADPTEAVIVHSLKITYHAGRDTREFFVSMSSKELAALSEVLQRAAHKEKSLARLLTRADIPHPEAR